MSDSLPGALSPHTAARWDAPTVTSQHLGAGIRIYHLTHHPWRELTFTGKPPSHGGLAPSGRKSFFMAFHSPTFASQSALLPVGIPILPARCPRRHLRTQPT